jgi:hypothetical protein
MEIEQMYSLFVMVASVGLVRTTTPLQMLCMSHKF